MSAPDPTAVAPFRYTVIAPLVTRTLTYGEQRALLRDLVADHVEHAVAEWREP